MERLPFIVSRYVAHFGLGLCMAAAASAEDFPTSAAMVYLAYVCAFLCIEPGRRAMARVAGTLSQLTHSHAA